MNTKHCFYCLFCMQVKPHSVNNLRKGIESASIYFQVLIYLPLYMICINVPLGTFKDY